MQADSLLDFGPYRITRRLAIGGTAEVFQASLQSIHGIEKTVALKIILPDLSLNDEFSQLFIDEAKLLTHLKHPNIVQLHEFGEHHQRLYLAMEYVDGINLSSFIDQAHRKSVSLPLEIVTFIILQISRALAYAHNLKLTESDKLGVIHRDISPHNILISREGDVKLTDFGIAQAVTKTTRTQTGIVRGKLRYMSPEQSLGKTLDHRSDQYSLGVVFFELLTGTNFSAQFQAGNDEASGAINKASSFRKEVPQELDDICEQMLSPNPNARFDSCFEVSEKLAEYLAPYKSERLPHQLSELIENVYPKEEEDLQWDSIHQISSMNFAHKRSLLKSFLLWCLFVLILGAGAGSYYIAQNSSVQEVKHPSPAILTQVPSEPALPVETSPPPPTLVPIKPITRSKKTVPSKTSIAAAPAPAEAITPEEKQKETELMVQKAVACPNDMKMVKDHLFMYGSMLDDPDRNDLVEEIASEISSTTFCIDIFEYPNRSGEIPLVSVSWEQAKQLCENSSKRLCSSREWEAACKANRNFRYPYGNSLNEKACNIGKIQNSKNLTENLSPSGSYPKCSNAFGIYDMSGNAGEWVQDSGNFDSNTKITRGGAAHLPGWAARCSSIRELEQQTQNESLGFRCCKDLE